MTDEPPNNPYLQLLSAHAEYLDSLSMPGESVRAFYEIMSGALIWTDETLSGVPSHLIGAMRLLFAYRTSLMLGEPREEFKVYWDHGLTHFPNWIGFRSERRQPTPDLLALYRRENVSLRKCLRNLEKAMEQAKKDSSAAGGETSSTS